MSYVQEAIMSHRLQCDICGEKSIAVDNPNLLTQKEHQAIREFVAQHEATCAVGSTSKEPRYIKQVGPFGSEKPEPQSVLKPHGHFEYIGPYGEQQHGDTLQCAHCPHHW